MEGEILSKNTESRESIREILLSFQQFTACTKQGSSRMEVMHKNNTGLDFRLHYID